MSKLDVRDKLKEHPFNYQMTKSNKMMIFAQNKMIMTLGKKQALKLNAKLEVSDEFNQQLLLAKATGHYKHGNEKNK
ncbi:MAG: hypothetical protein JEZ08_14710 [Clostridiales bacterium]|nr:hypothetical protein [Clostridiales bacterium]